MGKRGGRGVLHSTRAQIAFLLRQKEAILTFCVLMLLVLVCFVDNCREFRGYDIMALAHTTKMGLLTWSQIGYSADLPMMFTQLYPLLVVCPAGFVLAKERGTQEHVLMITRMGSKTYYFSKLLSAFVVTAVVFTVPFLMEMMLYIIAFTTKPVGDLSNWSVYDPNYVDMVRNYAVNEGEVSRQLGLPGRPAIAEELQVMRDVMLAKETGARVHICHISTAGTVNIIRRAKAEGVAITCETCPQYFILTEEEVLRQGTMARVNPPLRTAADRAAILEGLKDGTIDAIVTDHAPHCAWEKAQPLDKAPSGMVGLETSLGLALTYLYHAGHMSLMKVIDRMSTTPASLLRLPGGTLQEGCPADLVLFDPDQAWTVDRDTFASKGRNTPFHGFQLKGKVKYTISMGQIIYQEDE